MDNHASQFPAILHMTTKYKIHWISKWSYAIQQNLVVREYSVKWWDALKIDPILSPVNKDYFFSPLSPTSCLFLFLFQIHQISKILSSTKPCRTWDTGIESP